MTKIKSGVSSIFGAILGNSQVEEKASSQKQQIGSEEVIDFDGGYDQAPATMHHLLDKNKLQSELMKQMQHAQ